MLSDATQKFLDQPPRLWIAGGPVVSDGHLLPVENPACAETLAQVPCATAADVDAAVKAARAAWESGWRDFDPAARGELLWRVADAIDQDAATLAELETLDNGKPLAFARSDVANAAKHFRYFAGWTTKIEGRTIPVSHPALVYTRRESLGVVGLITPWNFPLLMAAWKIAPALACGNAAVIKPADQTPLTTLRLGELLDQAGVPPGVLNVVTGDGPTTGAAIVAHPGVAKVSFTGSTAVGRAIMAGAAHSNLKKVSLELGGKNPQLIFADANLDAAVENLHWDSFFNSGQECTAASRVYIEAPVYDRVVAALCEKAAALRVGDGMGDVDQGPMISAAHLANVLAHIQRARGDGARILTGGERLTDGPLGKGYFIGPTVIGHDDDGIGLFRDEIFGPVVAVSSFESADDVLQQANRSEYGLAAGIWTDNLSRAHALAAELEAGMVWINGYDRVDPAAPFGGYKQSGFGREMGAEALDLFTQTKTIWVGLPARG
jgi:acyl-CoA reductase-like NAD-dependent aldehyde dehydrogenase